MSNNSCNVNIHTHICVYYVDDSDRWWWHNEKIIQKLVFAKWFNMCQRKFFAHLYELIWTKKCSEAG